MPNSDRITMKEGIYQKTYDFAGKEKQTRQFVAVFQEGDRTFAADLKRSGNGTEFDYDSSDGNPVLRDLPIQLPLVTAADLHRRGVIHSCINLKLVEEYLGNMGQDLRHNARLRVESRRVGAYDHKFR